MLGGYFAFYTLFACVWPVANAAHGAHAIGLLQGFLLGLALLRNFVEQPGQARLRAAAGVSAAALLLALIVCNAVGTGGTLALEE